MSVREDVDLDAVIAEARDFHRAFGSMQLATSKADQPVASYAPYVTDDQGHFYIYLSELAQHTGNLMVNPNVSFLFIENEQDAAHLFGRRRLTYQAVAECIPRDTAEFDRRLDQFEAVHGGFMKMLRGLVDFRLFVLRPSGANFVRGFAQAYELQGADLQRIRHVNDRGHRPRAENDPKPQNTPTGGASERA